MEVPSSLGHVKSQSKCKRKRLEAATADTQYKQRSYHVPPYFDVNIPTWSIHLGLSVIAAVFQWHIEVPSSPSAQK